MLQWPAEVSSIIAFESINKFCCNLQRFPDTLLAATGSTANII